MGVAAISLLVPEAAGWSPPGKVALTRQRWSRLRVAVDGGSVSFLGDK